MTCGMHEYYLVLHVHIHITSKNGDVCKLCATERIFDWHDPSYDVIGHMLEGQGSWNFQGGRKKDGRKAIEKNGEIRTLNKNDILEKPQGGCINPSVPAKVNTRTGGGVWESHRLEGGGIYCPPSISAPMRASATNFGGYLGPY